MARQTEQSTLSSEPSLANSKIMKVNIGINETDRRQIAEGLARFLADSYTLYLKTHNFHWNVTGPHFQTLHTMFESQYTALAEAVDEIAERIRALGFHAPATYVEFSKLTSVQEEVGTTGAAEMVRQLVEGHETVIRTARLIIPTVEDALDEATLDLLTERMHFHEKTAWMLRSHLEGPQAVLQI